MISTIIFYGIFVVSAIYVVLYGYNIIIRHGDAEKAVKINHITMLVALIIVLITEVLKYFGL